MRILVAFLALSMFTLAGGQGKFQNPDGPPVSIGVYPRIAFNTFSVESLTVPAERVSTTVNAFKLNVFIPLHSIFTLCFNYTYQPYRLNNGAGQPLLDFRQRTIEVGFKFYIR